MNIAITGHRPQGIDNDFTCTSENWVWIRENLTQLFTKINPKLVISGMALGVDIVAAEVALAMNLPLLAAIPFPGQDAKWSTEQREHYNMLLNWASETVLVDKGPYSPYAMQKRNEFMVDQADMVIAVWNGFKGGTRNCVEYALRKDVPVFRLDPKTRKIGRYDGTKHIVKELTGA